MRIAGSYVRHMFAIKLPVFQVDKPIFKFPPASFEGSYYSLSFLQLV